MAKARKLKSGNWNCRVFDYTDEHGKIHSKSFTAPTKKEAEYLASEFMLNKKRIKNGNISLGEAIDNYIKSKDNILSPTTIRSYKRMRKNNFQHIMCINVDNITTSLLQNAVNEEAKKNTKNKKGTLSPKSIKNAYGLISSSLRFHDDTLVFNIKLPSVPKKVVELPSPNDLINAVRGTDIELICMLALWLGFSLSEIKGIKASSIIDDIIYIQRAVIDVGASTIEKDTPKTEARNRGVKAPKYIMELIKKEAAYKNYIENNIDDYLITMKGDLIRSKLKRILIANNLPIITPHKLRHLNASIMLQLNIPDKYAMERGGWSTNNTMKNVYQHTFTEERKIVDSKIDDYFSKLIK